MCLLEAESSFECCTPNGTRKPLLEELHVALTEDLLSATLPSVATRLGLSARSLQRQLHELGTSFRSELANARVSEAQRRMRNRHVSLTAIALDVGFASIQAFGRSFRRDTGVHPSAWRSSMLATQRTEPMLSSADAAE